MVLREAISKVQESRFDSVTEEEIKLIRATHDIFAKRNINKTDPSIRLMSLLQSTLTILDEHQHELTGIKDNSIFNTASPTASGSQPTTVTNNLMAEDAFEDIQLTSMRTIEEIELDINVRIFEYDGETIISGDILSNVLVKVTNGGITINGFVSGYVVVDNNINIHGNIQVGGLITNTGFITLERSLMGATLISKSGSINCDHLESPEGVFAWDALTIQGPCLGGISTSENIIVEGKITSTELRTCGHIQAQCLNTSSRSQTIICLLNNISCEDYNRKLNEQLKDKSRQVAELNKNIISAKEADQHTYYLIHNAYRTGLFYLLGGIESANTAVDLQGKQVKALYLRQLVAFAESDSEFYKEVYDSPEEFNLETINDFRENFLKTFKLVKKTSPLSRKS
jgi:hypothetical protein